MSSFIDFRSLLPTKQASAWLYLKPGDRFIPDFPVHRRQSNQHSDLPQYVVTERKGLKSLVVSSPEGQLALNVQDVIFKSAYNLSPALLDARRKNTLRPSDPAPAWARDLDDELCRPIPNKAALTITRRIIRRYENRELGFHFNVWEGLAAVVPSIREFSVLGINQQRQIAKLAWDHLLGVTLIPMGHTDSFSYRERDANRLYWQNLTITQRTINEIEALQNEVKTIAGDHLFRQLTAFTSGALEAPFPSLLEFSSKWYVHFDSYDERSWSFPTMHHVRWAQIGYEASCRQLLSFWQCMANPALYEEHGATVLLEVCRRNKLGSERTSYLFKCIHGITFGRRRDAFVPTCEDVLYSRASLSDVIQGHLKKAAEYERQKQESSDRFYECIGKLADALEGITTYHLPYVNRRLNEQGLNRLAFRIESTYRGYSLVSETDGWRLSTEHIPSRDVRALVFTMHQMVLIIVELIREPNRPDPLQAVSLAKERVRGLFGEWVDHQ